MFKILSYNKSTESAITKPPIKKEQYNVHKKQNGINKNMSNEHDTLNNFFIYSGEDINILDSRSREINNIIIIIY